MGNEQPVIRASQAKFGKTLLGGFSVDYRCPRCKQALTTKNEAVANGDHCPHCNTAFVFDDQIRQAFASFLSERQLAEQKRQVEYAEKEAAREAKRQEKARLDAEAAEQYRREMAKERARLAQQEKDARNVNEQNRRTSARDVSGALGCLHAILAFGVLGVVVSILFSLMLFANANSLNDHASLGGNLFVVSVGGAVSLALTYVLFRLLGAIHAMLVLILERLEADSDRK